MHGELQAITEPGKRFVALAEEHAADFSTRADRHDREGSFPFENIAALQKCGFMAAPVPEEFGGFGLSSAHDHMVGMNRLARGCASTAIAANMHLIAATIMARIWQNRESAPENTVNAVKAFLAAIGAGQLIGCAPNTEAGTDLFSPMSELTPVDGGYLLNGRKIFGTLSPAAQIMFSTARLRRPEGDVVVLCVVPKGTPGMDVKDDWDALGMRGSGSGDVVYTDVKLPETSTVIQGAWGVFGGERVDGAPEMMMPGGSLSACFLGIAEAAQAIAIEMAARRKGASQKRMADRSGIQQLIGENEVDLYAARAAVRHAGLSEDALRDGGMSAEGATQLMRDHQCMKRIVERNAIQIVDRAMTVSGGAGYLSNHPLSRLYRDVRAGPFMQPFGAYEVLEYLGKSALGIDPPLDR